MRADFEARCADYPQLAGDGVDTADRATTAELTEGMSPAAARDVEAVLEAFAAERLLTLAADSVEISHEVLLTAWPLLRDTWLAETHADRIVRTRLHSVAAEWARNSRDPSYLYDGSLLEAANGTVDRIGADPARNPPLSQTERDFLRASDRAHRQAARKRHAVIAGLLALTLTALTIGRDRRVQRRKRYPATRHRPIPPAGHRQPRHRPHQSRDRAAARRRCLAGLPYRPSQLRDDHIAG